MDDNCVFFTLSLPLVFYFLGLLADLMSGKNPEEMQNAFFDKNCLEPMPSPSQRGTANVPACNDSAADLNEFMQLGNPKRNVECDDFKMNEAQQCVDEPKTISDSINRHSQPIDFDQLSANVDHSHDNCLQQNEGMMTKFDDRF